MNQRKSDNISAASGQLCMIPTDRIRIRRSSIRRRSDDCPSRLVDSIKRHGILQPITVRRVPPSGDDAIGTAITGVESEVELLCGVSEFEVICGERRLLAAKLLKIDKIPCILTCADDKKAAEIALIENLHRQDLNFFELAEGIASLIYHHGMTQEEVAKRLSLSQPSVANKLRLLRLPANERELILSAGLSERHARAILKLPCPERRQEAIKQIARRELSVSQAEQYIDRLLSPASDAAENEAPRQILILKDLRIFYNTLDRAISTMERAGVNIVKEKRESDDSLELLIKIQKNPPESAAV